MAVRRKSAPRGPRTLSRVTSLGTLNVGGDLGAAAAIIADRARELASSWSVQVPPSISVSVAGRVATISADAPPARPNELNLRHPVFARGPRDEWTWVSGNDRPFLAPAADSASDAAMQRYAKKIDGWARKAGFN